MTGWHEPTLPGFAGSHVMSSAAAPKPCPTCNGTGTVDPARLAALMDRPGITGRKHGAHARRAGSTPAKGTQRHRVLELLVERGPMTAHDIADRIGRSPNQMNTRLGELHDDLFVEYHRDDDGTIVERESTPGNTAWVHRITPAGIAALEEVRRRARQANP